MGSKQKDLGPAVILHIHHDCVGILKCVLRSAPWKGPLSYIYQVQPTPHAPAKCPHRGPGSRASPPAGCWPEGAPTAALSSWPWASRGNPIDSPGRYRRPVSTPCFALNQTLIGSEAFPWPPGGKKKAPVQENHGVPLRRICAHALGADQAHALRVPQDPDPVLAEKTPAALQVLGHLGRKARRTRGIGAFEQPVTCQRRLPPQYTVCSDLVAPFAQILQAEK